MSTSTELNRPPPSNAFHDPLSLSPPLLPCPFPNPLLWRRRPPISFHSFCRHPLQTPPAFLLRHQVRRILLLPPPPPPPLFTPLTLLPPPLHLLRPFLFFPLPFLLPRCLGLPPLPSSPLRQRSRLCPDFPLFSPLSPHHLQVRSRRARPPPPLPCRYCAVGAVILADLSGSLLAKSLYDRPHHGRRRILGFAALAVAVSLLSYSWDRIGCFPLFSGGPPEEGCARVAPMLLPFVAGFIGFYERAIASSSSLRELGRRRVRLFSLAFATAMLFVPASISFLFAGGDANDGAVPLGDLGWPLLNTVIFGVLLRESYNEDKLVFSSKDFRRHFAVTFFCTLLLELFYFPKLSLPGFILCGFLLWIAVIDLGSSSYVEIGSNDGSNSLNSLITRPIKHILSERKSRKIALFLLINTTYMVVEFVAGFMSNSLGLISDACHMLFDCATLAIGLYASYISRLPANSQFNYGRGRFEVLSGYANAVFLVLVVAMIVLESFERILDPQEISTNSLLAVSIGGLMVNVIGLVFFHEEHHHAHGNISTCSHLHSHAHEEHHHHHHKHESKNVVQVQDKDVEIRHNIAVAHGSNQGPFHGDSHNVGHCPDNDNSNSVHDYRSHKHDNCSHDHADHNCHGHESKHIDSHEHAHEHGKKVNHHHGHEHADHIDSHEHDYNDHVHGNQVHVSQDFSQLKHEHKNAEVSKSSHSLCSEDHIHNHGDKKPSELSHATQHACTRSHSTELCPREANACSQSSSY